MAFTGTATVVQVSDSIVRITGLSLGGGASGVIGLADHTGSAVDVALPDGFNPSPYVHDGTTISLSDMLDVTAQSAASPIAGFTGIAVAKTGTTTPTWRATLTCAFASGSPGLEIYVKLHT